MRSAGQRCYSGPAAGVALADRVSASNASHALTATAGGGTRPTPRAAPAATQQPRAELGGRGPGDSAGPGGPEGEGDGGLAGGRERRDTLLRRPPSSRSGAPRRRDAVQPARGCPRPIVGGGHNVPLSRGMLENGWVQPWARWMRTLCPRRCPALPVPARAPAAAHCPRRPWSHGGQPDLWGNLLSCRGSTPPAHPPSARSRLRSLFLGGGRAGPGQLRGGYRVGCYRAKGTGLCLAPGDSRILPHGGAQGGSWRCLTAGRKRRDEAGASVLAQRGPKSCSGAGARGARPLTAVPCRAAWLQHRHRGCWQQGREQASPLSEAIFRCWREAEER